MTESCQSVPYDVVPPSASAMIESMRAYGYSLPVAIADLIDNSISAGASNVWLTFHWGGQDSWIAVADDGSGMSEAELVAAMRLGSKSPLAERSAWDLGRFGLGMKTASFSQCRRMTVRSVHGGSASVRRWDLDYIASQSNVEQDGWRLLRQAAADSDGRLQSPAPSDGTVVLWEQMDRVTGESSVSSETDQRAFHRHVQAVRAYLGMVFHRYLQSPRSRIRIFINGRDQENRIQPWNPFLQDHPSTQATPAEPIAVGAHRMISVKGFVLPHKDRLGHDLHRDASGPAGWNAQQGFYVYRNERLLVAGDWLGLGQGKPWTKEEHYKLARIQLDLPNTMDQEWQIDVKKSVAVPPAAVRGRLLSLAKDVRQLAREVFAHRGQYGPRSARPDLVRPWLATTSGGRPKYRIDRNHPLVSEMLRLAGDKVSLAEAALQVIEETVPVQRIWLDAAEKPDTHLLPFEDRTKSDVKRLMQHTYEACRAGGSTSQEALDQLRQREEFREYGELLNEIED
ncbi:MAG: ATP-binding protein [Phycisphaeraceae bacterium]